MPLNNEIGELGEKIFNLVISRDYKFRASHLGEKWPISDFYIELIGLKELYFFIVQVKSTDRGLNSKRKLKIEIPKDKLHKLNEYNCPTYIAGVDVNTEKAYLMSINSKRRKSISSFSTKFELTSTNRERLFKDVISFWQKTNLKKCKSKFKHIC